MTRPEGQDLHTTPEAEDRAERAADNPALVSESVAKAERRANQGWPWPVSGDATTVAGRNGRPYFGKVQK